MTYKLKYQNLCHIDVIFQIFYMLYLAIHVWFACTGTDANWVWIYQLTKVPCHR